jgi:hypothetical protein
MAKPLAFWSPSVPRPSPPSLLLDDATEDAFAVAPEIVEWALATFVRKAGRLHNPDHQHLAEARVVALWTNVENTSKGRRVIAFAETPRPPARANKWEIALWRAQLLEQAGGELPDFRLIFDAHYSASVDDATWCATVEHELMHCAQRLDEHGAPRFRRDGSPVYAIAGHPVEEFPEIVRRYGVGAAAGETAALVAAAQSKPLIAPAAIVGACGTCARRAA